MTNQEQLIIQKVRELAILLSHNEDVINHGHLVNVDPAYDVFTCDLDDCDVLTVRIDLEKI